jgi:outer membrane protein assembly factor BamD (BamD/ComL family)
MESKAAFERFGVQWTPTVLILDESGVERHRLEGFLPLEDFLAQLELGLAKLAFRHNDYSQAERRFHSVCETHGGATAAPEACYWEGVSAYKAANEPKHLKETYLKLSKRYPDSEWAKKASVWAG